MKTSIPISILLATGFFALSLLSACATVKPYQKNKLNDAEMIVMTFTNFMLLFYNYFYKGSGF